MRVAVSSRGSTLESQVDPRFGRCPYFIIVDTEFMRYEAFENSSMASPSGAGIGAARLVASHGVEAVITGNIGPNALQVLSAAGIRVYTRAMGTVRGAIEAFKSGRLREEAAGTPFKMGVGRGMGFGRGMGRGMRWGLGYQPPPPPPTAASPAGMSREEEVEALTRQLEDLGERLREVKRRLRELRGER